MTALGSNCLKRCILISQKPQEPNVQLISATSPLIPCWHPFKRSSTASAAPQRRGPAAPRMLCPPAQTLHFLNLPWALAALLLFSCRQDTQLCLLAAGQPGGP